MFQLFRNMGWYARISAKNIISVVYANKNQKTEDVKKISV